MGGQKAFAVTFPLKAFPLTEREKSFIIPISKAQLILLLVQCDKLTLEFTVVFLIKRHLLTFSYTASHLPLEFTVRVLPPLFLLEQIDQTQI